MSEVDVLVVGAGPTGLTLALQAAAHGATVRIVDRRPRPDRPSRAMIVHPRTLEVLRPLGLADDLLERGDRQPSVQLHLGTRTVTAGLADLALADTAFPHLLLVRQGDVEAVLLRALAARGPAVEWATTFEAGAVTAEHAVATLRAGTGTAEARAGYLVGCDGAASRVRTVLGADFPSAPYAVDVVLADLELDGDLTVGAAHAAAARGGLVLLFALGERATWRLLATVPARPSARPAGETGPPVPPRELRALVARSGLPAQVTDVAWSARIPLRRGMAGTYRAGRGFLAGDAAHTHSPAGGQGMNTGIQDAANLGWKLAACRRGDVTVLLGSYELERRAVARKVLAMTQVLFWAEAGTGPLPGLLRGTLAPLAAPVVPAVLRRRHLVPAAFRVLSGLRWHYRDSPLSVSGPAGFGGCGAGPRARPGERLPDQDVGDGLRLHDLTAAPGVHVLLQRDARLAVAGPLVHVHRIRRWPGTGAVVVRPDGYVGYRGDCPGVADWLRLAGAGR